MGAPLHLTLTKWIDGTEDRYVFIFDVASISEIMRTLGKFAGDPDLSFSWHDAAVLSKRVRELKAESKNR